MITRTIHGIAYNPVSDEVVVPQFYAQAVMTYRGGTNGDEAPIRVIQGPDTQIANPARAEIDPVHKEVFVPLDDRVLVFPSEANGNVAPIRVLKGPSTSFEEAYLPLTAVVDPVNNLLIVAGGHSTVDGSSGGAWSLMIFNRTDSGDVKPRAVIGGPKTRISSGLHVPSMAVYPARELFLAVLDGDQRYSRDNFVGVWSEHSSGEVPPLWTIGGPNGILRDAKGLAIDPKSKSVFVTDKYVNAIMTYYFQEIF